MNAKASLFQPGLGWAGLGFSDPGDKAGLRIRVSVAVHKGNNVVIFSLWPHSHSHFHIAFSFCFCFFA